MPTYETYEDGIEVKGATVRSMLAGVSDLSSVFENRMRDTLAQNGIEDPQKDEWYPKQAYLDAFAEIEESIGSQTMTNIGKKIPDNAEWPPGIDSVSAGLDSIDDAYQMNHRGGEIGFYETEQVGDSEVLVTCRNPYPCDFDEGLVTGVAEKFSGSVALVDVTEESNPCRNDGGGACVYRVTW